jgi:beta-mannosidase
MVEGMVQWELRDPSGRIMKTGEEKICIEPLSTYWLDKIDFSNEDELGCYFSYRFLVKEEEVSSGTCLFTAPKHFPFKNPNLMVTRQGNELIVHADAFARFVEIQGIGDDVKLSDNFFDMNPGEKRITILEGNPMTFRVRSVFDIAK